MGSLTEERGINVGWVKSHVDDLQILYLSLNASFALVYLLYLYFM